MLANRLYQNWWRGLSCRYPEQCYNIILFRVGWGRKASSCAELKRIQSAKCRVPHFSLPPILPLFWVAIFMYYAVHFLYNPSGKWETIRWTRQKLIQLISCSGTPLIRSPKGQKNLAVSTRVFYKKMYGGFGQAAKKSGHNNKVTVLLRWP